MTLNEIELERYCANVRENLISKGSFIMSIKVRPNAKSSSFREIIKHENQEIIKCNLKAVPEKGKANLALEKFCAKFFNCKAKVVGGKINRYKKVRLEK